MPNERAAVIKRELARFPDVPTKTIARKLYFEYPEWFNSLENARATVRYHRGNHGGKNRSNLSDKAHVRPNGKAGTKAKMPPSLADSWDPFEIASPARILSLSDIHVPYHDEKALAAAVSYAKKHLKPDVVLLNGDFGDFFTISRWLKRPDLRDLRGEIDMVKQLLRWLRDEFPKARMILKMGNHEERWDHFIWNKAPELWDLDKVRLENLLEVTQLGADWVTDQRPVMAGLLPVLHGHELPKGLTNPVNMARGAFLRTIHTVLVAHGHRTSTHAEPNMFHEEIACWSQGCLCDLNPEYARINKWNHGFAFIEVDSSREFQVENMRISDGKVRAS